MTPQESIAAYEAWCAANKSFSIVWKEAGVARLFKCHIRQTALAKINEVFLIIDEATAGTFLTVTQEASVPTFDGYKEWLQYQ